MDRSRLPSWVVPPTLLAVITVVVLGFALGGPPVGVALGALAIAAIAVVAIRAQPRGHLELGRPGPGGEPVVVFTLAAIEEPRSAERIAGLEGVRRGAPVLVIAPASPGRLQRWLSDLDAGRFDAQRVLAVSLASLAAAGVEAEGRVGDPDPILAVQDALRVHGAREVAVVVPRGEGTELVTELAERLDRPLSVVEVAAELAG